MLTYWEPNTLVSVLQREGEDAGVGADFNFIGEYGFTPGFGLEEDLAGFLGFGRDGIAPVLENGTGSFIQGANVVSCHHSFRGLGVWRMSVVLCRLGIWEQTNCHKFIGDVLTCRASDTCCSSWMPFKERSSVINFAVDDEPWIFIAVLFS